MKTQEILKKLLFRKKKEIKFKKIKTIIIKMEHYKISILCQQKYKV